MNQSAIAPLPVDEAPLQRIGPFDVRVNDLANAKILAKDIFERRIYHFDAQGSEPRILDCGANIGLATLYFKQCYPAARITAFEPDEAVLPYLSANLLANRVSGVTVMASALAGCEGEQTFLSDGKYGGFLTPLRFDADCERDSYVVSCLRLRDFLDEPVDFLKLDIEGAEWDVLDDAGAALRNVREMVIEYHHQPGLPRTLHRILELLDSLGFEYMINDFDRVTNPAVATPFRLNGNTSYFLLIYARRSDD